MAASGGAAFRRAAARPGGGIVIAAEASGDVLFPGGVSGGVGSGPYLLELDASEALLGLARLGRGVRVTTETGSAHVYALALGVGGVPVVGGTLYGTVNDGTTVIEQAVGAFGPDAFVWSGLQGARLISAPCVPVGAVATVGLEEATRPEPVTRM